MTDRVCSRRAFLRGMGVSMALPWLEANPVPGRRRRCWPTRGTDDAPVRVGVLFSGNGFHSREWWARGAGAQMELGQVLAPLADLRERLVLVRGLFHAEALKGNIHSSQTGNLLSGAPLAAGGEIRSGASFDQVLAQRFGRATKVPSLVIGCEKSNPTVHKNYSMIYSSHISWSSPTAPTPLEIYPALAFDRLFRDGSDRGDRSVLDAVLADADSVRRRLGAADQHKLDEYLESVREVERRIDDSARGRAMPGWSPASREPDRPRPADGLPAEVGTHMRLMCDIAVLAMQTDTTRYVTLKLNNDHSSMRFPEIGVDSMIHHLLSHTDSADWLKVNRFFVEHVGYLARRLAAIQEGPRTLLDNSVLLYLSSMRSGNHDADDLPVLLLGGAGGKLQGGRSLDYRGQPERQMCRLFLSLMAKAGLDLPRFGDATSPLPEV